MNAVTDMPDTPAADESDVAKNDRGLGAEGEETDMGTGSLAKDGGNDGKIVDLPGNGNSTGQDKGEATRPLDEEGLRELLLDLRSDITDLKKEQEEITAPDEEAHLYDLLAALKDDITVLKTEQKETAPPSEEAQMYDLLAELKHDINELKAEHEPPPPGDDEAHLFGMLSDLKSDIKVLKAEQEQNLIPAHEAHLYEMLADLKTDIKVLKAEQPQHAHDHGEDHLYGMLTELKQDIKVLQSEHDLTPVPYPAAAPAAPPRPKALRYMVTGAVLTLMILGAGVGGYVFSVYQQGGTLLPVKTEPIAGLKAPFAPSPAAVEGKEANAVIPEGAATAPPANDGLASVLPSASTDAPPAAPGMENDKAPRTVTGRAGEPVELKINLTGADVKPETSIVLLGIPVDAKLSSGSRTTRGDWTMTVWDTLRLTLTTAEGFAGEFPVTVALMDAQGVRTEREKFNVIIGDVVKPDAAEAPANASPPPAALPEARLDLSPQELKELIARAAGLIDQGDIVSARTVLDYAVSGGSAEAAYRLARTYDPEFLSGFNSVLDVQPDLIKAKVLYYFAARKGHDAASKRLTSLRGQPGSTGPGG